jgi:pteridine reductase
MTLEGKTILITGAARRVGRSLALAVAGVGANVIIHHGHSQELAQQVAAEVERLGAHAWVLEADLGDSRQATALIEQAWERAPLYALVNNAAIFEALTLAQTTLADWQRNLDINLTAPFLLSQAFAQRLGPELPGRIVNLLDWRALRPGADHFPYTVSKAALAALTQSLALALAPNITVNGLALGAILPPSLGGEAPSMSPEAMARVIKPVPAGRWAELEEVGQALLFLLDGPAYITGEIIHLDGGRHLV